MKLYNLIQNEDGSVKVETELTKEDMVLLITMGFYACIERGIMVHSLAHHFQPANEVTSVEQLEDVPTISWEEALEGPKNDDKA